jgi:hypothetical protein
MIDGLYTLQITFGAEEVEGVAMVKGKFINGLDWNRIYVVQFSGQHRESCWHFSVSRYTEPAAGLTTSGSHQLTCLDNSDHRFVFAGEMTGFTSLQISIHGEWIADLPKPPTGSP